MFKKIIWALVELITIAIGTGIFVTSTLDNYVDEESAGIGAFMVILGLLLKNWRKTLFTNKEKPLKDSSKSTTLTTGLIMIIAFTLWGMNYGNIKDNSSDINSLESKVDDLEYNSHNH
jgi:hypothetical protein